MHSALNNSSSHKIKAFNSNPCSHEITASDFQQFIFATSQRSIAISLSIDPLPYSDDDLPHIIDDGTRFTLLTSDSHFRLFPPRAH